MRPLYALRKLYDSTRPQVIVLEIPVSSDWKVDINDPA